MLLSIPAIQSSLGYIAVLLQQFASIMQNVKISVRHTYAQNYSNLNKCSSSQWRLAHLKAYGNDNDKAKKTTTGFGIHLHISLNLKLGLSVI